MSVETSSQKRSRRARARKVRRGDHLRVDRGGYYHHGIGLGDGNVVHYADVRPEKRRATIRVTPLRDFSLGSRIEVVGYADSYAPDVVVARALSRLGETRYHLANNNCEHFARWCTTGQSASEQVRVVAANVGGTAAGALGVARSIATVSASGAVEGLSGPGVLSGLRAVGTRVGVGAAGGLGVLAIGPAVAATVAVHHRYADDPCLPLTERRARRLARISGTTGALGGAATVVAIVSASGVPGLSGAGIASGLASIGALLGGGMVAGVALVVVLPILSAAFLARASHRVSLEGSRRLELGSTASRQGPSSAGAHADQAVPPASRAPQRRKTRIERSRRTRSVVPNALARINRK